MDHRSGQIAGQNVRCGRWQGFSILNLSRLGSAQSLGRPSARVD